MTLAWPDGKYALPEAATLAGDTCPAAAFTWDFGMLYQNTDTAGVNTCSRGNHLTNYCDNESLRSYYCVKSTPTASSSSWSWMPGVYCIYKVGTTCPDGESHNDYILEFGRFFIKPPKMALSTSS